MWKVEIADMDSDYMRMLLKEGWEPFSASFSPLRGGYVVFLRQRDNVETKLKDTENGPTKTPRPRYLN